MKRLDPLIEKAKSLTGIDIRYARGRKGEYVRIKRAIANIAVRHMSMGVVPVSEELGYTEHSSICHHKSMHDGWYRSDDEYAHLYDQLLRDLPKTEKSKLDTREISNLIRSCL